MGFCSGNCHNQRVSAGSADTGWCGNGGAPRRIAREQPGQERRVVHVALDELHGWQHRELPVTHQPARGNPDLVALFAEARGEAAADEAGSAQ